MRLEAAEPPLTDEWPRRTDPAAPDLVAEFAGAAPTKPQALEDAVHDFYTAIGVPTRPRGPVSTPRRAPAALTPRAAELRRLLTSGTCVTGSSRATGYAVSADGVRLYRSRRGAPLSRDDVVELRAALTAWLTLPTSGPQQVGGRSQGDA
ncbi:hypothetical protein RB200_05235 [Streptomyces sp. PmtG]